MNLQTLPWRPALKALLWLLRYVTAATAIYLALENTDDAVCAVLNAGLFLLPLTLALAISGRRVSSLSIAAALSIFLYVLGELKFKYFGDRLALADYSFLTEPANWAIVWRYPLLWQTLIGFALFVALLGADALLDSRGTRSLRPGLRLAAAGVFAALAIFSYANRHHHQWEVFRDDADCGPMHTCGVMSRLIFSSNVYEFEPPAHTEDPTLFVTRKDLLPPLSVLPNSAPLPDVVVWLNESTFNPSNFKLPNAHLPRMEMFEENDRTRASGLMRVHTFGGKTWLSEFSVLTGLVPDDFGARRNLVFNSVGPKVKSTLVHLLKANGYRAVVLMPTMKRFYGAGRTYEAMGFDEVLTLRDFHEYDKIPGDEWDIADSDRLSDAARSLIAHHRASPQREQPIFLYMLSVHEHAPYSKKTKVAYGLERAGVTPTLAAKFTDYVNKLRVLNQGITAMDNFVAASAPRPMLFAYFGDHQAYYEENSPPYRYELRDPKDITQFQIRANFGPQSLPRLPLTDIAFLPSLVADFIGVKKDEYFNALSAMRRLCDGKLEDCPDQTLVQSYKGYVFSEGLGLFQN
jgi:phosphoglycerol transferase MdoB-like AlkP superfamily enzyme